MFEERSYRKQFLSAPPSIPSVIAYNIFTGRVQGMTLEIHSHVSRLIPFLSPKTVRVPQEVEDARRA